MASKLSVESCQLPHPHTIVLKKKLEESPEKRSQSMNCECLADPDNKLKNYSICLNYWFFVSIESLYLKNKKW